MMTCASTRCCDASVWRDSRRLRLAGAHAYTARFPPTCPDCGGVVQPTGVAAQYQEDLPIVRPIVRRFDVHVGAGTSEPRSALGAGARQCEGGSPGSLVSLGPAGHGRRYFGYATREALHLTQDEQALLTSIVRQLEAEASVPPDPFASEVLTAQLQLLFTHCQRAYARQLDTRARDGGIAERLDRHLSELFASGDRREPRVPTVASCARALGYSADYLSDLLRIETGASARDHIHRAVIEAAKARLLSSDARMSDVAYARGFEHPQHFSRLFKRKTGHSPGEWRRVGTAGPLKSARSAT